MHLEMLNVTVDRRYDRRSLSDDEISRVLTAAKTGGKVFGFTGAERYIVYVVALSTGLRASELASLKPQSLRLLDNPPTVTVRAGYSKRRRLDVLPIPSSILNELRTWVATRSAGKPLCPGRWAELRHAGRMLQVDLKAAGVEYKDADGLFADFHALRHTYITNRARHGVPLATAQKLARHSTPVLTAVRYTHIDLADQSREVEKLPRLDLGRNLGQMRGVLCPKVSPGGNENAAGLPGGNPEKQRHSRKKLLKSGGEAGIRTLGSREGTLVFETSTIDHSVTSPGDDWVTSVIEV